MSDTNPDGRPARSDDPADDAVTSDPTRDPALADAISRSSADPHAEAAATAPSEPAYEPVAARPAAAAEPATAEPVTGEPVASEPVVAEPTREQASPAEPSTATAVTTPATDRVAADPEPTRHDTPAARTGAPVQDGFLAGPSTPAPVYVHAPQPPIARGNRGGGTLIALIGTVAFALLYAGIIALLFAPTNSPSTFGAAFAEHLISWRYILPVALFAVALILLVLLANRAGWWAYVLGGFLVGVVVWAATAAGFWVAPNDDVTAPGGWERLLEIATLPIVLLAGIAAREVTVWAGAWIAHRGRKVRARNVADREEYERQLSAGPGDFRV